MSLLRWVELSTILIIFTILHIENFISSNSNHQSSSKFILFSSWRTLEVNDLKTEKEIRAYLNFAIIAWKKTLISENFLLLFQPHTLFRR